MKKILAIGIIALLALGVGLGVVSGLTRNEVEPPQPLGIGIDGGDLSVIECIQGQDAVCTATATSGNTGEVGTSYPSIVATIYPADKKDFRLNPYRVFGVNGAEPRY